MKTLFSLCLLFAAIFIISCESEEFEIIENLDDVQASSRIQCLKCGPGLNLFLPNPTFESHYCNSSQMLEAFAYGCVGSDWANVQGTPSLKDANTIPIFALPAYEGEVQAILLLPTDDGIVQNYREAIALDYTLFSQADMQYSISYASHFSVESGTQLPTNPSLYFYAANDVPTGVTNWNFDISRYDNKEISSTVVVSDWVEDCNGFTVPSQYDQIIIFPDIDPQEVPGSTFTNIGLDDIEIHCCSNALSGINCILNENGSYTFTPIFSGDNYALYYTWIINGEKFETENVTYNFPTTGTFDVVLNYSNLYGCPGTVKKEVVIGSPCPPMTCDDTDFTFTQSESGEYNFSFNEPNVLCSVQGWDIRIRICEEANPSQGQIPPDIVSATANWEIPATIIQDGPSFIRYMAYNGGSGTDLSALNNPFLQVNTSGLDACILLEDSSVNFHGGNCTLQASSSVGYCDTGC